MTIITIDKNNFLISVPSFPLFLHCTLYSIFVPYLLHSFPESFTLCEVSLLSQGASLLLTDTSLLMLIKVSFIPIIITHCAFKMAGSPECFTAHY